jgi:CyaY protein
MTNNMTEQDVLKQIDATLRRLEQKLDALNLDDADIETADGKITIAFDDRTKFIISRQLATGQIWLAEPAGGWRFSLKAGEWLCDKRGIELFKSIEELLTAKTGGQVSLT